MKTLISNTFRWLGLIYLVDIARYSIQSLKNKRANNRFKKKYPEVKLPPDYLLYESFQINYDKYYNGGLETAKWLINLLQKHQQFKNKKILDWGCGPGRIIRHLPTLINNACEFYGTDYNKNSIEWCSKHLDNIHFNNNSLEAKLPYDDNTFDLVYGISIFTHLSEQLHYDWIQELTRIIKPKGILMLTTHGDSFKIKLSQKEKRQYESGQLVIRGNTKEGHRTYTAFQPNTFMRKIFEPYCILEHIEREGIKGQLHQNIWIVEKK